MKKLVMTVVFKDESLTAEYGDGLTDMLKMEQAQTGQIESYKVEVIDGEN